MAPRRKSQESLPIEKLLTIKQAASILDVSPKKVGRLIKNGEIAVVKVGKRHRITIRELQDFIERNSKPCLQESKKQPTNESTSSGTFRQP